MSFERARKLADAVLYEGYVLYPYRSSSAKNQLRWQFGVLAPATWVAAGGCEHSWTQTEILIEPGASPRLTGKIRFLQLQRRTIEEAAGASFQPVASLECEGRLFTPWDEGVEREIDFSQSLLDGPAPAVRWGFAGGREVEEILSSAGVLVGRLVRELEPIAGELQFSTERCGAFLKATVRTENVTPIGDLAASRDEALRSSFVGTHTLLEVEDGAFVSSREPAAALCQNLRTWPVLVGEPGERRVVLSSPIILDDYPQIAAESPGDLCDATEIDEILTLRILTLTDAEKREARATDPRSAAILDRVDAMSPEMMGRLHGALRSPRAALEPEPLPPLEGRASWWDPGADASVSPDTDAVVVAGISVSKGSSVRLRPGRRADAQDMFLAGRAAVVQGVYLDVEDNRYVAVTLADDPAADLHARVGRYLYFYPDEIEPTEGTAT